MQEKPLPLPGNLPSTWERKLAFGIFMKKLGMWDSRGKGVGMRDQEPPPNPYSSQLHSKEISSKVFTQKKF